MRVAANYLRTKYAAVVDGCLGPFFFPQQQRVYRRQLFFFSTLCMQIGDPSPGLNWHPREIMQRRDVQQNRGSPFWTTLGTFRTFQSVLSRPAVLPKGPQVTLRLYRSCLFVTESRIWKDTTHCPFPRRHAPVMGDSRGRYLRERRLSGGYCRLRVSRVSPSSD